MNCDLYRSEMYGIPCRQSSFAQTFRERGLCRSSCGSKSSGDCDLAKVTHYKQAPPFGVGLECSAQPSPERNTLYDEY
jgi:hypothetical protein